jgi:hypothetical protein
MKNISNAQENQENTKGIKYVKYQDDGVVAFEVVSVFIWDKESQCRVP